MTITRANIRNVPTLPIFVAPYHGGAIDIAPSVAEGTCHAARTSAHGDRFAALHAALSRHGGCLPADEVCALLRPHWSQPLSRVARWIARREVASVMDRGRIWLPLFQFERPSLDLSPAAVDVIRTLRDVHDDWELIEWFARPHDMLGGQCPAARLISDPRAAQEAARFERFINRW